ncbi:polysaccharide deacetylase family protein [Maribellus maritimus]|uniref:polysaccharide deacetylase family protein n=1 Tax=Maribellus maritimus TaxID=2870838 RepID=UPI001EEA500A|nr:polysaccharide deacetylase family protein [Maribellus maritimus]MCG6189148.1 polysaccharide deacetylase family protein [Maribellus maritimus]
MNKFPRFVSQQVSRLFPVNSLFKITTPAFLPFYHVVSDRKLPHIQNYPYRNTTQFERELDFYLNHFKPVSLEYLLENRGLRENIFHLSFDDGLKECAEVIAPILQKKGIPATFFVNTAFVDNKMLFHKYKASLVLNQLKKKPNQEAEKLLNEAGFSVDNILSISILQASVLDKVAEIISVHFDDFLKIESPYLTRSQIFGLKKDGFSIGAHSCNHPEFWKISEDEQLEQVQTSMAWINENLQPEVKAFAFPFTDDGVPAALLDKIEQENICDITFGTAGLKYDTFHFHFQRYPVETGGDFIQNIKAEWVYFFLRKWMGKARVKH